MCGRARCSMRPDDFPRACHLAGRPVRHVDMNRFRPSYNVSPGFNLPVIRRDDGSGAGGHGDGGGQQEGGGAVLQCMKWGLIPSFTKKTEKPDHYRMFNARSESLREKASFRRLIPNNRCLVSFEGFYEWKKHGSKKQPYYICFRDGRPLVFAALFDSWKNAEGEIIYTFTIVTTSSSSTLEWLHDRMPVILSDKESTEMWLSGSSSSNLDSILKPYGESDLAWHPVTTAMGKPSFDGPECIIEIHLKKDETKTISQFFSKKEVKSDQELEVETSTMKEEPMSLKEESETENDVTPDISELQTRVPEVPAKRESGVLTHSEDGGGIDERDGSPMKKKCRGFGTDTIANLKESSSKPSSGQPRKPGTSPGKKKAPFPGDKQPTLFSYFGKG